MREGFHDVARYPAALFDRTTTGCKEHHAQQLDRGSDVGSLEAVSVAGNISLESAHKIQKAYLEGTHVTSENVLKHVGRLSYRAMIFSKTEVAEGALLSLNMPATGVLLAGALS